MYHITRYTFGCAEVSCLTQTNLLDKNKIFESVFGFWILLILAGYM